MNTIEQEVEKGKQELATKLKVPKEINEKIYSKLAKEFWIASAIFIYFLLLNAGYTFLAEAGFQRVLKIFTGVLAVSTVVVFEIAYRKDSDSLAIHGVELLGLSCLSLFMPYVYFHRSLALKFLYSFSSMYIAVYYSIKALIIYEIEVKRYFSSLSDVKEIVIEETGSHLDEVNERRFEDERKEDEEVNERIENQIELNKKNKKKFEFIKKKLDKIRADKVENKVEENAAVENSEIDDRKENVEDSRNDGKKINTENIKVEDKENNIKDANNEENKELKDTCEENKTKKRRKRKKKEVKSIATAKNKNKENGEE